MKNKYKKYMKLSILLYALSIIINMIIMGQNLDIKPGEIRTPIMIAGIINLIAIINLINSLIKYFKEKRILKEKNHENK